MPIIKIQKELQRLANPKKAKILSGFFKTGKGQYGEGDKFLGLTSSEILSVAHKYYQHADFKLIQELLNNNCHEYRVLGFRILTLKYLKSENRERKQIYNFYIKNTKRANNWDLVDLSAPNIVGAQLLNADKKILYKLARSKNLWQRRIAIISTLTFIRSGRFDDTIKIADILLADGHDLIHKAVGWMLREVGKKDEAVLKKYLSTRYSKMPRTMLRYAIEKFPENIRKKYLAKTTK